MVVLSTGDLFMYCVYVCYCLAMAKEKRNCELLRAISFRYLDLATYN